MCANIKLIKLIFSIIISDPHFYVLDYSTTPPLQMSCEVFLLLSLQSAADFK